MSTIKSSTTTTTAYQVVADTTGALVIQTGATPTTAVTVGTDQSVTFANALPVASGGTAATTASAARTSLGLVIGTDVLAPSGSGASLTALNATNISSGTLAKARLPAGSVLQVAQARKTDTFSTSSTTLVDITGMSVTMTPTSASSKFLVYVDLFVGAFFWNTNGGYLGVSANGTNIAGNSASVWAVQYGSDVTNSPYETMQWTDSVLYSPNTISSVTFNAQIGSGSASYAIYINRAYNNAYGTQGRSVLTVMEIAG
jgi:hypothetical protein